MGQVLGDRYRLDELIGSGGMGAVWRATDLTLGRAVAVKTMRSDLIGDAGFDARFRAEARTLAALNHPNVVDIYDYGQCDVDGRDVAYLVMAYVHGQPLSERLAAAGRMPASDTMSVVAQAAEALHAVHGLGVVHRDVKPANLLVQPDGTVVLVDFGVARSPATTSVNTGAMLLGSALYMAPEQARGQSVSPVTDVYALGVVAYHCLAGYPPFTADTPLQVALMHTVDEPPPLPDDIPPAARQVVARAMAKDPAARYPSAAALATAAARYAGRPVPLSATAVLALPAAAALPPVAATAAFAEPALPPPAATAGVTAAGDTAALAPVPASRRRAALIGAALGIVLLTAAGLALALHPSSPAGAGQPTPPASATVHGGTAPAVTAPARGAGPARTGTRRPARTANATPPASAVARTPASGPTTGGTARTGPSPAAGDSPAPTAGASPNAPVAAAASPTRASAVQH